MSDWSICDKNLGMALVFLLKIKSLCTEFEESISQEKFDEKKNSKIVNLLEKEVLAYAKKLKEEASE